MILKNNALQELYDTLANGTISFSPYAESPVEKAFKECDERLQKDIDIWKCGNEILLSANMDLANKNRKLEQDHESDVRTIGKLHSQMVNLEDEKTEREKRADILKSQRDMVKKALDELKRDNKLLTESRDEWSKRAIENRKQITKLEKDISKLTDRTRAELEAKVKRMDEITKELVDTKIQLKFSKASNDDWKKDYDELMKNYQDLSIKFKRCQINVGRESRHLWDMLQNVRDVKPEEFDPECETLGDILDMDLEDFLDAYENWQEEKKKKEKETDRMRNWLTDFCDGRCCKGCPLESDEYKCGLGHSFKGVNPIPDKDIKRYYEKARDCGRSPFPIKDLVSWECTIEATVEINKDLLEKVCGVKPDDK